MKAPDRGERAAPKVIAREAKPAPDETSPAAVADLLGRAARQRGQRLAAQTKSKQQRVSLFELPPTHFPVAGRQARLPGIAAATPAPLSNAPAALMASRRPRPHTPPDAPLSERDWLRGALAAASQTATAIKPAAQSAARLFGALRRSPPSGPTGNGLSLSHSFEHALSAELSRGRRVLAVAGIVGLGWAGFAPLSGAVIVAGSIVVHSSVKKVQHPSGGVVAEIFVRNGGRVEAGDRLLRLDETAARANLQVIARQFDEVRMRIARLVAERDGAEAPNWPSAMSANVEALERDRLLASERDFFLARATARRGEKELAGSRIQQLEKQIAGLESQLESNTRQRSITEGELKSVENLLQEKLVTIQRATNLRREAARLDGLDGQLSSQIAETRNKVSEARLQALQIEQNFRSDVMRELSEAGAKEGELMERRLSAEDQAQRTIIRAPSSGAVHDLTVNTRGGVISPGETLMAIVPDGDALEVDARLSPDKIDQVRAGQNARVRFSAFNGRTTPELSGAVDFVSPDIVRDPQSGAGYYDIRISLRQEELHRLGDLHIVPGMPAEVFLETESRTMLSYLLKPLTDQLSRSFRER